MLLLIHLKQKCATSRHHQSARFLGQLVVVPLDSSCYHWGSNLLVFPKFVKTSGTKLLFTKRLSKKPPVCWIPWSKKSFGKRRCEKRIIANWPILLELYRRSHSHSSDGKYHSGISCGLKAASQKKKIEVISKTIDNLGRVFKTSRFG